MTKGQKALKTLIREKNRLPHDSEVFELYIENVMMNSVYCRWDDYKNRHKEYPVWELTNKARNWYRMALGALIVKEEFHLIDADEFFMINK
jgi:hypothetical protein